MFQLVLAYMKRSKNRIGVWYPDRRRKLAFMCENVFKCLPIAHVAQQSISKLRKEENDLSRMNANITNQTLGLSPPTHLYSIPRTSLFRHKSNLRHPCLPCVVPPPSIPPCHLDLRHSLLHSALTRDTMQIIQQLSIMGLILIHRQPEMSISQSRQDCKIHKVVGVIERLASCSQVLHVMPAVGGDMVPAGVRGI